MDFGLRTKVDEDEGSSLRNEVNLFAVSTGCSAIQPPNKENRTISGSLPGTPYPIIFPSKENFANNTARVIAQTKGNRRQKINRE